MLADGTRLVITERNYAPFSWRNCIVISRKDYESNGAMIIAHEQAHVHHHHSFDLILAQMFCAVQWFNPAAWMLRRSLMEVHEFEADAQVQEDGFDGRRYQICLVRAALQGSFATTTNNFSNCSTKKRIVMMNRHSTNPWARLRVLLMLPAVALSVIFASACKQDAIEETNLQDNAETVNPKDIVYIEMEPEETHDDVFMVVEEMPEFPGGTAALTDYLKKETIYPEQAREDSIQGRVLLSFVVEKDGSISNPTVVKSSGNNRRNPENSDLFDQLDAEALRVLSQMPKWNPGMDNGALCRVQYAIPINFRLN
jgi:TonB family protein